MHNTDEPMTRRLRAGIASIADLATLIGACVALLRVDARGDGDSGPDRDGSVRAERFRALFGPALVELSRNIAAWTRGMTDH
jgi:hypothetical protein